MLKLQVNTSYAGVVTLEFEHSLLSVSKWEDKTGKVFLSTTQKSPDEMLHYYGFMLTSPEHDPDLVIALTADQQRQLTEYMNTSFGPTKPPPPIGDSKGSSEPLSAVMLYAQMTMLRVPWEAQTWNIHRLLTTLAWIAYKQTPEKDRKDKRPLREKLQDWATMNEANRRRFNSNG